MVRLLRSGSGSVFRDFVRARNSGTIKTGALAMPTIAVSRTGIVLFTLWWGLGVWPMTAAAAFLPKIPRAGKLNVTQFVYLTDISRADRTWDAHFYDRFQNTEIRVRSDPEFAKFHIKGYKGQVSLEGTVLHISPRDVIFRAADKVFAIRVGQTLEQAMRRSLTDDDVIDLNQDIRAPQPTSKAPTITLEMGNKPWGQVLEWLGDQTGLPVLSTQTPKGTFTYSAPRERRARPLGEIMDILNEALARQKLLLIRRDLSIVLIPTDEKINPSLVPRIPLEDLASRGKTELVSLMLPLQKLQADDIAGDVAKLLGPFGKVAALARANQLALQDAAGNLRSILQMIKGLEEKEAQPSGKASGQPPSVKAIALEIRSKPWHQVLEWLGEQTGLPVHAPTVPTGTVTLIAPKGKTYTIPEIIDLLNDALAIQKYRLTRLEQALYLIERDQKVDGSTPRVRSEDLGRYGNSEILTIDIPLKTRVAADLKNEVQKLLGPEGKVIVLDKANQLVVRGCVVDLKQILQTIKAMEDAGKVQKP
jgi:hypothetical protein